MYTKTKDIIAEYAVDANLFRLGSSLLKKNCEPDSDANQFRNVIVFAILLYLKQQDSECSHIRVKILNTIIFRSIWLKYRNPLLCVGVLCVGNFPSGRCLRVANVSDGNCLGVITSE